MSLFRKATLLFPYWSGGRLVNTTNEDGHLINHDVYVNGVSMRSKLDETLDIGIGRVTGYYLAEKSVLKFNSRRLTIVTESPLNLTIPRHRIPQLRRLQLEENFMLPRNNQTDLRLDYIYPDEVVEYILRNGFISPD